MINKKIVAWIVLVCLVAFFVLLLYGAFGIIGIVMMGGAIVISSLFAWALDVLITGG